RLDPKTGVVKEYRVPTEPGVQPGTHWTYVDKNDIVWMSNNWGHKFVRIDSETDEITTIPMPTDRPKNAPGGGNWAIDPDGYIWRCCFEGAVIKVDPET